MIQRRTPLKRGTKLVNGLRHAYVTPELEAITEQAAERGWRCVGDLASPKFRRTLAFCMLDAASRFALTCVEREDGCWEWVGSKKAHGYGQFRFRGTNAQAHRVAYELHVGPIPAGMTLDHTCHNADQTCQGGERCPHRRCVNPDHLVPTPGVENYLRANRRRPTCKNGHPVSAATRGRNGCTICTERNVVVQSDRIRVNLMLAGAAKAKAKLSDDDILLMREMRSKGVGLAEIATQFGITRKYASAVITGSRQRKRRHTGPAPAVRRTIHERSDGNCEFVRCSSMAAHVHHRRPRRMGGSMAVESNLPGNLVHLCVQHHEWVESNRRLATALGLLLSMTESPADVPARTRYGYVLLLDDGDVEEVDPSLYPDRLVDLDEEEWAA